MKRTRPGQGRGQIHVYTGDGKGKTTAAMGLALRAAGAGLRVYIGQFAKGRPTGEQAALAVCAPQVVFHQYGRPARIDTPPAAADVAAAANGLAEARAAMLSGDFDVVILDEALVAATLGLLPLESILEFMAAKPAATELVLTGRDADPRIVEKADLVTDMRKVKHYYDTGVQARPGIEF